MAVCRRCFHSPSISVPASPREPLRDINNSENGDISPPKKALFSSKENSAVA